MTNIPTPETKRTPFKLPDGFVVKHNCRTCYGIGHVGYDTVRRVWVRCGCVERVSEDDPIDGCRIPTESELRQAEITNIPTRGFCVSAEEERITAESYRYLYDPEEFETPDKEKP